LYRYSEAGKMDAEEVGAVLRAFANAGAKLSPKAKAAIDAATLREAPRMTAADVASTLTGYADAGAGPPSPAALNNAAREEAPRMHPEDAKAALDAYKRMGVKLPADVREALEKAAAKKPPAGAGGVQKSWTAKEKREAAKGGKKAGWPPCDCKVLT
jgi:hypothetical protein